MSKIALLLTLLILTVMVVALLPWQAAQANTFEVTNTNESGPGSLRQAITDANNHAGSDIITFAASTNGTPIVLAGAADDDINMSGDVDILDGGDLTIWKATLGERTLAGSEWARIPAAVRTLITTLQLPTME